MSREDKPLDQNQILYLQIVGFIVAVALPIVTGLKWFLRQTDYDIDKLLLEKRFSALELSMSKEYVRKDDLAEFKTDLDKRLDEIKETQRDIFKAVNSLRTPGANQ
jgi:hypothetical protein